MMINGTAIQSLVAGAANLQNNETQVGTEMSSGMRIARLSDDPAAIGLATSLAQSLAADDIFLASADTVKSRMQATDSALGSVVTQLTSAISIATAAVNGTENSTQLSAAAMQLTSLRDGILTLANSSYAGSPLFGGTSAAAAPFSEDASGSVTYSGDTNNQSMTTATGAKLTTSLPGSFIFMSGGASSVFEALNSAIAALSSGGPFTAPEQNAIVSNLDSALQVVTSQRATLNASQSRLNTETTNANTQDADLKAAQSTLLSADPAALATELSADETQRSALLSTIAIVQKGSLFDYLNG